MRCTPVKPLSVGGVNREKMKTFPGFRVAGQTNVINPPRLPPQSSQSRNGYGRLNEG